MKSSQNPVLSSFRFIFAALVALILASPQVGNAAGAARGSSAVPARVDKAEEAVLLARDAFRSGNSQLLARVAPQARGHVLEPYVEYWQLRQRLEERPPEELRDFLTRHQGTYLAERLRADWLRVLARRNEWDTFRNERPQLVNDDPDIACLGLLERFRSGDAAALGELKTYWLAPKPLPEGCVPLADHLIRGGDYGSTQIWARFRLLADANLLAAAKRAITWLPAREQPANAVLDRVYAAPERYLLLLPDGSSSRMGREMVIFALMRLSRTDPQAASVRWNDALRNSFSAEDQAYVWGQIASWGARRHMPESMTWFARANTIGMSDEQLAWRARIALRLGAWPEVRSAIELMSPLARMDPTWIYWRARALKEAGSNDAAQAEFARIASEFNFYGQLASEERGLAFKLPPQAAVLTSEELRDTLALPGLQRALAFFRLDMRTEAVREWNWALRGLGDRQLIAAAEIARRHEIWDRAISTADRTVAQHDFALRYLAPYQQVFAGQARAQKLEEHWVLGLVRQESRFISNAKSSAGAAGLMQLMPATARWVANKMGMRDFQWADVHTIEVNAALGSYYLRTVLNDLDGHPVLASAAYNAGPGRARRWQDARPMEGAIYAESIPFDETRDYVKKVMTNAMYYAAVHGGNPRSLRERMGVVGARGRTQSSDIP